MNIGGSTLFFAPSPIAPPPSMAQEKALPELLSRPGSARVSRPASANISRPPQQRPIRISSARATRPVRHVVAPNRPLTSRARHFYANPPVNDAFAGTLVSYGQKALRESGIVQSVAYAAAARPQSARAAVPMSFAAPAPSAPMPPSAPPPPRQRPSTARASSSGYRPHECSPRDEDPLQHVLYPFAADFWSPFLPAPASPTAKPRAPPPRHPSPPSSPDPPAPEPVFTTLFQRPNRAVKRPLSAAEARQFFFTGLTAQPGMLRDEMPSLPEPEGEHAVQVEAARRAVDAQIVKRDAVIMRMRSLLPLPSSEVDAEAKAVMMLGTPEALAQVRARMHVLLAELRDSGVSIVHAISVWRTKVHPPPAPHVFRQLTILPHIEAWLTHSPLRQHGSDLGRISMECDRISVGSRWNVTGSRSDLDGM